MKFILVKKYEIKIMSENKKNYNIVFTLFWRYLELLDIVMLKLQLKRTKNNIMKNILNSTRNHIYIKYSISTFRLPIQNSL